jgi:hypothetical protein
MEWCVCVEWGWSSRGVELEWLGSVEWWVCMEWGWVLGFRVQCLPFIPQPRAPYGCTIGSRPMLCGLWGVEFRFRF